MSEITDKVREQVYDIVLAARTEGIISGKTKRFATSDRDAILAIKVDEKHTIEDVIVKHGKKRPDLIVYDVSELEEI